MKYTDGLRPGNLLRIKKHCRNNITIRNNGEFALLAPSDKKHIQYEALFPSGVRVPYMPMNWEILNA